MPTTTPNASFLPCLAQALEAAKPRSAKPGSALRDTLLSGFATAVSLLLLRDVQGVLVNGLLGGGDRAIGHDVLEALVVAEPEDGPLVVDHVHEFVGE